MKSVSLFGTLLLTSAAFAAEARIQRDLPYAEPKNERQTLDVYARLDGRSHPIVFWIHGGGWRQGSKNAMHFKPEAFVDKGFVFVAMNYRFVPQVTIKEMTSDIAKAIRYTLDHAKDFEGRADRIFVMGHSAGAHLAALVCTDERYLKAEGLSLSIVKGCVPVDTAAYDVVKRAASAGDAAQATKAKEIFGIDEAAQREVSPITYIGKVKSIPPFLILHVADRPDSTAQSKLFAKSLQDAGISAALVPAEGKTHGTINSELGLPTNKPTLAVFDFLERQLK